eukprot:g3019.t1
MSGVTSADRCHLRQCPAGQFRADLGQQHPQGGLPVNFEDFAGQSVGIDRLAAASRPANGAAELFNSYRGAKQLPPGTLNAIRTAGAYTQWKSPICPPDPMDATTRRNTDRNSGLFAGNVVHGNGVVTIEKDFEDGFEAKRRMYQETTPVDERSLNGLEDTSNPLTKVRDVHAERRESERQAKAKAERDRDNKYLEAYREESRILSGEPSVELEKENADSKDAGIFTKDETKKVRFADGVNPAEDENFDLEIRGNKRGVAVTRMRVADVENNYVDKITGLSAQLKRLDSTSSLGSVHSEERMQVVDKMRTIEKFRRSNSSLAALEELDANGKPLDSTSALDEGEMSVEDYQKSLGRDLAASRQRDVLMRKNARQQRQQRDFGENVEVVADEGEQPDADGFLKKPLPLPIRPFFLGLYTAIGGIYCVVVVNQEASEKYGDMTFASWTEANCRIGSFTDKCSVCTDSEECGMSADALYSNGCQFEILIKYGDSHQDRAEGRWLPEWDFVENEYRLMPREHFGECPGGKSTDPPTLRLPRAQMNLRENCCLYYDKTRDLFCDMWSFGSKDGFWPCRVSEDSLQYESRAQQEGEVPPFASKWIFGHNKTEYFTYAGLLLAVTLLFWKVWRWPAVLCHKYNEQIGAYKNAKKKWEEEETKRRAIAKMKAAGISGDDEDGAFGGRKGSSQKMFYYADPPTDSDSNYELDPEALNDLRGAIEQGFSGKTKMKKGKLPKGLLSPPKKPGQRSLADPDATYAYDSSKNPYRPDHLNFSGHSDVADRRYSDAQRPGSRDKTAGSRATRADRLAESFRLLAGQTASLLFGRQSGSGQEAARSWNDRRVIQAGDLSFASRGAYADREEEGGDSYDRERPPLNPAISHAERKKELEYADGAAALSGVPPPDANRASRDQKSNWTSFGGFRNKSEHLVPLPENLKEQKSTVIRMEDSKELFKRTGVLPEKRSNVYENLDKLQNRGSWSANSFAPASAQPGFREAVRARNSGGLAEASSAEENFDFANENNHPFRSKSSSKETTSSKETHLTSASAASSSQQSQKYNDLGEFAAAQQMNRSKEGKPSYYPSPNKARVRGSDFGPGNPGPGAAYYDHGIGLEQAIGSELVPKITRKELRTRSPLKARVEAGGILGENELRQMLEKKRQPPVKNLFAAKFRSGGGTAKMGFLALLKDSAEVVVHVFAYAVEVILYKLLTQLPEPDLPSLALAPASHVQAVMMVQPGLGILFNAVAQPQIKYNAYMWLAVFPIVLGGVLVASASHSRPELSDSSTAEGKSRNSWGLFFAFLKAVVDCTRYIVLDVFLGEFERGLLRSSELARQRSGASGADRDVGDQEQDAIAETTDTEQQQTKMIRPPSAAKVLWVMLPFNAMMALLLSVAIERDGSGWSPGQQIVAIVQGRFAISTPSSSVESEEGTTASSRATTRLAPGERDPFQRKTATFLLVLFLLTATTTMWFLTEFRLVERLGAVAVAVLANVNVTSSIIFAVLLLREPFSPQQLLGCALIIAGIQSVLSTLNLK